jgi:hypothetical protein
MPDSEIAADTIGKGAATVDGGVTVDMLTVDNDINIDGNVPPGVTPTNTVRPFANENVLSLRA